MLKSCRALSYACSSIKQAAARSLSVSAKCRTEVTQDEINKLFSSEEKESMRRVSYCLNRVELIGGVASDIRVRTGRNGKEFIGFNLATNQVLRNNDGERIGVTTEFHSVVSFNAVDVAKRELAKGQRVFVSGRIHYTPVSLVDGSKAARATIVAENYHIIKPLGRRDQPTVDDSKNSDKSSPLDNIE